MATVAPEMIVALALVLGAMAAWMAATLLVAWARVLARTATTAAMVGMAAGVGWFAMQQPLEQDQMFDQAHELVVAWWGPAEEMGDAG